MAMLNNLRKAAADSLTEDIQMIHVERLFESPDNFFALSRIDELADAILEQGGVKENLIVRKRPDANYEIVSGHRRAAAVRYLLEKDDEAVSEYLPCLVEDYKDEADKRLSLVLMNLSARQISDAEMLKSYEVIKEALAQNKSRGVGRMRDRVAELLGISGGQAAKIENIAKNAAPEVKEALKAGEMSISTADKIAKLDKGKQKKLADKKPLSKVKPKDIDELLMDNEPQDTGGYPFADEEVAAIGDSAADSATFPDAEEDAFDSDNCVALPDLVSGHDLGSEPEKHTTVDTPGKQLCPTCGQRLP